MKTVLLTSSLPCVPFLWNSSFITSNYKYFSKLWPFLMNVIQQFAFSSIFHNTSLVPCTINIFKLTNANILISDNSYISVYRLSSHFPLDRVYWDYTHLSARPNKSLLSSNAISRLSYTIQGRYSSHWTSFKKIDHWALFR